MVEYRIPTDSVGIQPETLTGNLTSDAAQEPETPASDVFALILG